MSCQRCGGVSADELAAAMYALVCGMAVIENRHCHCDDVEGLRAYPLQERKGTLVGEIPAITTSEGETP